MCSRIAAIHTLAGAETMSCALQGSWLACQESQTRGVSGGMNLHPLTPGMSKMVDMLTFFLVLTLWLSSYIIPVYRHHIGCLPSLGKAKAVLPNF